MISFFDPPADKNINDRKVDRSKKGDCSTEDRQNNKEVTLHSCQTLSAGNKMCGKPGVKFCCSISCRKAIVK